MGIPRLVVGKSSQKGLTTGTEVIIEDEQTRNSTSVLIESYTLRLYGKGTNFEKSPRSNEDPPSNLKSFPSFLRLITSGTRGETGVENGLRTVIIRDHYDP